MANKEHFIIIRSQIVIRTGEFLETRRPSMRFGNYILALGNAPDHSGAPQEPPWLHKMACNRSKSRGSSCFVMAGTSQARPGHPDNRRTVLSRTRSPHISPATTGWPPRVLPLLRWQMACANVFFSLYLPSQLSEDNVCFRCGRRRRDPSRGRTVRRLDWDDRGQSPPATTNSGAK